jgi:hypothetical protein
MTRHFTDHSKQYLKQYFKRRYTDDDEFRSRVKESNNVSRLRTRLIGKINVMMLSVLAELYEEHIF